MKGDFTRSTFDPSKHYHGVRMQQGRVQLDADWNEQVDISTYRAEVGAADVIGPCGAPIDHAGFALTNGTTPQITPGRYYVDGILCENEAAVDLDKQLDLPGFTLPVAANAAQFYLVYLDVWQRHITALDDALLREVALGGPDTATRSRTVWQVKLLGPSEVALNCLSQPPGWAELVDARNGTQLNARAKEKAEDVGECEVAPGSGYRRLENQLYRVEVHQGGTAGKNGATFKWSRDNGSIVARWKDKVGDDLIVDSIGRDDVLRFAAGQWVELIDDQRELNGLPGTLVQLLKAEGQALTIDPATASGPVELADFGRNLKIRRWDHVGTADVPLRNGAVPVAEGTGENGWIPLEDGVEVQFQTGGQYKTGDYWLIPARTNTADIEWPRDPADATVTVPKRWEGIEHHFCPLGILEQNANGFTFDDCRKLFPPVTRLTVLHYAGGDGQDVGPGQALPFPLRVRVLNGEIPVVGAAVSFTVLDGGGALLAGSPVLSTAPDGLAEMQWQLGQTGPQRVEAALLDAAGNPLPGQRIQFDATVAVPGGKGCCTCVGPGGEYERLQDALGDLLKRGQQEICICLAAGRYDVDMDPVEEQLAQPLSIKITGCGEGTVLFLKRPLIFRRVSSVLLADLAIRLQYVTDAKSMGLDFDESSDVTIENCSFGGVTTGGALVRIVDGDRVRVADSQFEAVRPDSYQGMAAILDKISGTDGGAVLSDLFKSNALGVEPFRKLAIEAAAKLAQLNADQRGRLLAALQGLSPVSFGVLVVFLKIRLLLMAQTPPTPDAWLGVLMDFRQAVIKFWHGTALIVGALRQLNEKVMAQIGELAPFIDQDDLYVIERNSISGALSLYGEPRPTPDLPEQLNANGIGTLKQLAVVPSTSLMGTLQLRGNQVVRITVSQDLLAFLVSIVAGQNKSWLFDAFARSMVTENLVEGGVDVLVGQQVTCSTNEFTGYAAPPLQFRPGAAGGSAMSLLTVAARSLYLANVGDVPTVIFNVSPAVDQSVNQGVTIQ